MFKMNDNEIKSIYKQLKGQIDEIMDVQGIDFVTMSKVMHQLVAQFDNVRKQRYP